MAIKSYIAHPKEGKKEALRIEIQQFSECEYKVAENQDIILIVTDTKDDDHEKELYKKLSQLNNLELLSLVAGYNK